ncbi:hypothetical protein [Streptomyces sp. NPDC007172]|uniref:Mu transposase domain-containing protein n=1 Tax=Streptomyces sp. NPDC007172 TaxID=3364776 RepID=UPI0036C11235
MASRSTSDPSRNTDSGGLSETSPRRSSTGWRSIKSNQISVRGNTYSVPVRFIGRQMRVLLHANELIVYYGRIVVTRHERVGGRNGSCLVLDHYLEALMRKPGAFPGSTALEPARSAGRFTPVHDKWWTAAKGAHGDEAGTRALIEVLLLAWHMDHEQAVAGRASAYRAGALTGRGRAGSPASSPNPTGNRSRRLVPGQSRWRPRTRGRPRRYLPRRLAAVP